MDTGCDEPAMNVPDSPADTSGADEGVEIGEEREREISEGGTDTHPEVTDVCTPDGGIEVVPSVPAVSECERRPPSLHKEADATWCVRWQKRCFGVFFFECSVLLVFLLTFLAFTWITVDMARAVPRDVPIRDPSAGDALYAHGDQADGLFWFVQISDLHVNAEINPKATVKLQQYLTHLMPVLTPHFTLATGDLADSRPDTMTGVAFGYVPVEEDWVVYEALLEDHYLLDPYYWVDVRGNHDVFGVSSFESEFNYYCEYSSFARLPWMCNYTSIVDKPDHSHMNSAVSLGMGDNGVALHPAYEYPEIEGEEEADPWTARVISAITVPMTAYEAEQRVFVATYDAPISVTYTDTDTGSDVTTPLSMPFGMIGFDVSLHCWAPLGFFGNADSQLMGHIRRILPSVRQSLDAPCADLATVLGDESLSGACPTGQLMSFSHYTVSLVSNPDTLLGPLLDNGVTTHIGGHLHTPMSTGSRVDVGQWTTDGDARYLYDRLAPDMKRHCSVVINAVDRGVLSTVEVTLQLTMADGNNSWDKDYNDFTIEFQWPVVLCTSPKHASYLHDLEPNHLVT
ncbi:hypothetical protein KIPB_004941, partial [Kipferlia bialata]|eukprot:g4941.t1